MRKWVLGGVGDENTLGCHAHGRRTRTGCQLVEWALGEELHLLRLLTFTRQLCRDTWYHPKSWSGHPIDHLLCRSRDHSYSGATKVLFEDKVGESWSAYTDHNPVEVGLAKGWVYRAPPRTPRKLRRPNWS